MLVLTKLSIGSCHNRQLRRARKARCGAEVHAKLLSQIGLRL